ncbi:MAG: hypothetical protein VB934_11850, partial [Polyangiaceae bacterium]
MPVRASVWLMMCASACTVSPSDGAATNAAFGGEDLGLLRPLIDRSAPLPEQSWRQDAPKENAFNVLLGSRALDSDYWGPTDGPVVFGLGYMHERAEAPLGFEVGFQFGRDSESIFVSGLGTLDLAVDVGNVYVGMRKTFLRDKVVQPFLGAGVELGFTSVEGSLGAVVVDDNDTSGGVYFHGGLLFQVTGSVRLGVDVRIGRGSDVTLFDVDGDLDYEQFGLLMEVLF